MRKISKEIVVGLILAAICWLPPLIAASEEEISALWVTNPLDLSGADERLIADIAGFTGVKINLSRIEVFPGQYEKLLVAIEKARYLGVSLIFGLTRDQVLFVGEKMGGLWPIPQEIVGFQSLSVKVEDMWFSGGSVDSRFAEIWGIPIEVSIALVCVRDDAGITGQTVSIEEIAYSELDLNTKRNRISFPNPRSDPVGLAVLLSAFVEGTGSQYGWRIVEALDQDVERYVRDHWTSCQAVAADKADIGFTMVGSEDVLKRDFSNLKFVGLHRAMYVPVRFASVLAPERGGHFDFSPDDSLWEVVRWLGATGVERSIYRGIGVADMRGLPSIYFDAYERVFEYFPVGDILADWSTRYDYKVD